MAYSYYTNNTCTAGPVAVNTVTVPTSGTVPNSSTATFNTVGTYYWQAVYSGDANNNGASSPCTATNNEQLTVNKASPTHQHDPVGVEHQRRRNSPRHLGAERCWALDGDRHGRLQLLHQQHLHDGPVAVNTVTVPTSGTVPNSSAATFNSVGTYYWQAVYSGDANNNGASSPCTATNNEQLTVTKASPTISTALSARPSISEARPTTPRTLTGDVADTGAGTVAYSYYTNNTCTTGRSRSTR